MKFIDGLFFKGLGFLSGAVIFRCHIFEEVVRERMFEEQVEGLSSYFKIIMFKLR